MNPNENNSDFNPNDLNQYHINPPNPNPHPEPFKSILIGAAVFIVVGVIPFLNVCCLLWFAGPIFTVYHFMKSNNIYISKSEGARLGIMTGILGGLAQYVISLIAFIILGYQFGTEAFTYLLKLIDDPQVSEMVQRTIQEAMENSDPLSPGNMITGVLSALIFNTIFGSIGGALGVVFFGKK